jgi:hypothetical protein
MKKRAGTARKSKKVVRARKSFRVSENLLVFFPKTSRMGIPDPSQWGQASNVKKSDNIKLPVFSSSQI